VLGIENIRGGGDVGGAWRAWLGIQPACPKGVNESRDKQRIVRTMMRAFRLSEEGKKKGVVRDDRVALPSTGGRNDTSSSWELAMPSSRMCHCDQLASWCTRETRNSKKDSGMFVM
jgi:hypothetical protein